VWLKQIFEEGSHQTSYIRDIVQEALNFKRKYRDPTLKSSPFFWTSSEERQPNGPPTREAESYEDWLVRILFRDQSPLQHGIYQCLFEITANGHVTQFLNDEQISTADKARFRSGAFEHAGKWLATIPREGFWMSTGEFRTAMQLRFGINIGNNILSCACGKASAQDHQHLLTCHLGNQVINRHTALVNYFCDLIKSAGHQVIREAHLLNEDQDQTGGPRSDFTTKRIDITTGRQRHQHYDVTVTNPASPSYTKEVKTHAINGAAAQRAHQFKMRKYSSFVDAQDFHPLVFETFGYWSEEVTNLVRCCCHQMEDTSGTPYSALYNYWISRLSFTLQWENAITIMERADFAKLQDEKRNNSKSRWRNYRRESLSIK